MIYTDSIKVVVAEFFVADQIKNCNVEILKSYDKPRLE